MYANLWVVVLAGLVLSCNQTIQGGELACAIPGEPVQWIADYCMASIGTDDEIAASDCILQQRQIKLESPCGAKAHFKRALCGLMLANGSVQGPIERCVNDPAFQGRTVLNGGVGS